MQIYFIARLFTFYIALQVLFPLEMKLYLLQQWILFGTETQW